MMRNIRFEHTVSAQAVPGLSRGRIGFPPFDSSRALFCSHGREALWKALDLLDVGRGDNVLVPDVLCPIVSAVVARRGAKARLYPVGPDLQCSPEAIDTLLDANTRAVLVADYFGFPQPFRRLRELCRDRHVSLIEDCAMALFSAPGGVPLGTYGDFAIFSFRKTLPVRNGAALLFRDTADTQWAMNGNHRAANLDLVERGKLLLLKAEIATGLPFRYLTLLQRDIIRLAEGLGNGEDPTSQRRLNLQTFFSGEHTLSMRPMSGSAHLIASNCSPQWIRERRAANYRRLLVALADWPGVQMPFPELPEGACPLYLPIYVDDRDRVHRELRAAGIPAWDVWPEVPAQLLEMDAIAPGALDFSGTRLDEAAAVTQHLLALPVHEGLTARQMDYIVKALRRALGR